MKDFFKKKMEAAYPKYSKEYETKRMYKKSVSMFEEKNPCYVDLAKEITKNIPKDMEYGKDYKIKFEPRINSKGELYMSAIMINLK